MHLQKVCRIKEGLSEYKDRPSLHKVSKKYAIALR